jgi:ubiquinone/menaquinone biosynthesis C-methylase UbiE
MSLGSYGRLATEVYDITKPIGHSFGDVEFYLQRLKSCTGRVLEPAVGTGRVLIPLMEAGLQIEGTDNSPEMLAVCRARCAERGLQPVLHEVDMGSLSLPERYEAIIVPAGSFLLIERREQSLGALGRFREHLLPGGVSFWTSSCTPICAWAPCRGGLWRRPGARRSQWSLM